MISLLEYRNTPTKDIFIYPAQLMSNCRLRTKLPISSKLLQPKIHENAHEMLIKESLNNKKHYDTNKQWKPAMIIRKHSAPRSYVIRDVNGSILRRNSSFLKIDNRSESGLKPVINHLNLSFSQSKTSSGKVFKQT